MIRSMGIRLMMGMVAAGFLMGLAWVFRFQFQAGGSYPQGSSLRADPKGTMILFESLQRQPGLEVLRSYDPPDRFRFPSEGTVLVLLNAHSRALRSRALRQWVAQGGRVIVSPGDPLDEAELEQEEEGETLVIEQESTELVPLAESPVAQAEALAGFPKQWETASYEGTSETAPADIQWRKSAVLRNVEGEVLYSVPMGPVVMRIAEGAGDWILLSHPGLFLNRSQYEARETAWIAWLIGDAERVAFEESHFGIQQPRGVMTLIRDAGLDVLLWAMLLPLGLAFWRGFSPLLPAVPEDQETVTTPLSRLEGYRDLLARHLPASRILSHAVEEWKRDLPDRTKERLEEEIHTAESLAHAKLPAKARFRELRERTQRLSNLFTPSKRAHHE